VKNEIGNVKVFQNSRISGAVNMTRDQTFAVCDIPLPAGEMLEAYEEKLTTSFFPEAMKNIETLRHPLVYEGVVNMNGDNAILRISVKCLEHDREQIKRELYRALKLWREQSAKKPPANA
jgi:small conductance mechanosensitive channel